MLYRALTDYMARDSTEVNLDQGDHVEVIRMSHDSWWLVRPQAGSQQGWAPAALLEHAKRASTISTQSTASTVSTLSTGSTGKVHFSFFSAPPLSSLSCVKNQHRKLAHPGESLMH